mmetsp:Transcript_95463/g.255279  ORF Transcript_95463/g.255279 Transcript_95463/m.255279 type:complete len:453 (-) Transcript_95463:83-1441(-)
MACLQLVDDETLVVEHHRREVTGHLRRVVGVGDFRPPALVEIEPEQRRGALLPGEAAVHQQTVVMDKSGMSKQRGRLDGPFRHLHFLPVQCLQVEDIKIVRRHVCGMQVRCGHAAAKNVEQVLAIHDAALTPTVSTVSVASDGGRELSSVLHGCPLHVLVLQVQLVNKPPGGVSQKHGPSAEEIQRRPCRDAGKTEALLGRDADLKAGPRDLRSDCIKDADLVAEIRAKPRLGDVQNGDLSTHPRWRRKRRLHRQPGDRPLLGSEIIPLQVGHPVDRVQSDHAKPLPDGLLRPAPDAEHADHVTENLHAGVRRLFRGRRPRDRIPKLGQLYIPLPQRWTGLGGREWILRAGRLKQHALHGGPRRRPRRHLPEHHRGHRAGLLRLGRGLDDAQRRHGVVLALGPRRTEAGDVRLPGARRVARGRSLHRHAGCGDVRLALRLRDHSRPRRSPSW